MFGHDEEEPQGPPPDPSEGHERTDVAARPILIFLVGLVLFGGAVQASMSLVMRGFIAQDTKAPLPPDNILRDTGDVTHIPLQQNTTADMVRMYREEDEVLNKYYVDPKTKDVRIPLDRAMEVIAKKGLPHRAGAKDELPKGERIPRAGRAYQTTN